MSNEPPMPGDWAAKMIPTLTEVVDEAGAVQEMPADLELGEPRPPARAIDVDDFLQSLEPQLRERIADAVSAALREQWGGLRLRIEAAVDQAVRAAIARALQRR